MDAETQLSGLINKFSAEVAVDARHALAVLEARLPTATRLVYDNYNALVVGFAPSDKASHAILSIALYPNYARLFFLRGIDLPDPAGILEGDGSQVRSIKLKPVSRIETPGVRALIDAAVANSYPMPATGKGRLILKSISAKQRPRRPAA